MPENFFILRFSIFIGDLKSYLSSLPQLHLNVWAYLMDFLGTF